MDVDLIFRIAAVGILVAVLGQLLSRSGREEQALMTTLAGLIVVLMLIVQEIDRLFTMMKKCIWVLTMELGLICGIVLAALTLSLVLKKDAPAIAFLLVLTAGGDFTFCGCSARPEVRRSVFPVCSRSAAWIPRCICRCARQSAWRSWCGLQLRFAGTPVSPRLPPRWRLRALS